MKKTHDQHRVLLFSKNFTAVIYDALFKASAETMLTIAADPKHHPRKRKWCQRPADGEFLPEPEVGACRNMNPNRAFSRPR